MKPEPVAEYKVTRETDQFILQERPGLKERIKQGLLREAMVELLQKDYTNAGFVIRYVWAEYAKENSIAGAPWTAPPTTVISLRVGVFEHESETEAYHRLKEKFEGFGGYRVDPEPISLDDAIKVMQDHGFSGFRKDG